MDAHDHGLMHDLKSLQDQEHLARQHRRQALRWLGTAGMVGLGGSALLSLPACGGGGDAASGTTTSSGTGTSTTTTADTISNAVSSCSVAPEETQGPYPGDGSNSANGSVVNALMLSGIVRQDIRTSVGSASGTADGVPLTMKLKLVSTNSSCASLEGYAIYLWHCTRDGKYSIYSSGATSENYLRGVQATDSNGVATFTTVFPGCYSGRMPHMHLEVYRSLTTATSYSNKLKTSQLAFPVTTCQEVYNNVSGYSASINNLAAISFATDNIFSDGYSTELVSITGDVTNGYVATIVIGISV